MIPVNKNYSMVSAAFIPSYTGGFINLGFTSECNIEYYGGSYWIRFHINGNYRYYIDSFKTEEEARKELINILKGLELISS